MKKLLITLFLSFTTLAFSDSPPPLYYSLKTNISSQSQNSFLFDLTQQIDFECQINSISPIDQSPQNITLIFTRIQGEAKYNDKKLSFDSEQPTSHSLEFQSLKKLLNQPISIELSNDLKVKGPVKSFEQILSLSSLEDHFISQSLLDQIVESVFFPLKSKRSQRLPLSIYFPFNSKQDISLSLKESQNWTSFQINEPLALEGLYSTESEPFSIHLVGKLNGSGKWHQKRFYSQKFFLSHTLKESEGETLFESPLSFDYSVTLNLIESK